MEIRRFEKEDVFTILELFELVFKNKMSRDYWEWRFLDNPFNSAPYIDLMWNGDTLVGHYAVSPIQMIIDGNLSNTALSMTTMTHPEYGGKGIFTQLANSLYKRLEVENFSMVWGFPNTNSHYGFIKNLSWQNIGVIPFLSYPVDLKNNKGYNNLKVKSLDTIDGIADDFFINKDKKVEINKNKSFLNWRYVQNPSHKYYFVSIESAIFIYKIIPSWDNPNNTEVDMVEVGGEINEEVLREFIIYCVSENENLVKINVWISLFSDSYKYFEKVGFRMSSPLTYLGYRSFNDSITAPVEHFKNWDISFTYSDLF